MNKQFLQDLAYAQGVDNLDQQAAIAQNALDNHDAPAEIVTAVIETAQAVADA